MCVECDDLSLSRRNFLLSATAAVAGLAADSAMAGGTKTERNLIADPSLEHGRVTFKNGENVVEGLLVRPRRTGRFPAVLIAHGNAGIPTDIEYTAAYLAKAGFVSLVYDWGSSAPMPDEGDDAAMAKWRDYIFTNAFIRRQLGDLDGATAFLRLQPFVAVDEGTRLVGFCGGGRLALLYAAQSEDVRAVVSMYGPVDYRGRQHATDPVPNVLDVVDRIKVPVQGHYGMKDVVAFAEDAMKLEKAMKQRRVPVEMYYYDAAGHSFHNFNRPQGSDPGFDYFPTASAVAHEHMVRFFKRVS